MTGKWLVLPLAALATACAFKPAKIFASYTKIEVQEAARSLHCNTPGEAVTAQLFAGAGAVRGWLDARGVRPAGVEQLDEAPYAVVELGQRRTGGHGLAVSRAAVLRGELLILTATFVSPGPGSMVAQMLTSPCVVVKLPPGRYRSVEVQDPSGAVRATGSLLSPEQP